MQLGKVNTSETTFGKESTEKFLRVKYVKNENSEIITLFELCVIYFERFLDKTGLVFWTNLSVYQ